MSRKTIMALRRGSSRVTVQQVIRGFGEADLPAIEEVRVVEQGHGAGCQLYHRWKLVER